MNLGSELVFKTTITHPGRSSQINDTYKILAGSYVLINSASGLNVTLQFLGGQFEILLSCWHINDGGCFKISGLPGEVISVIGLGVSQSGLAGSSTRTCGVI